MLVEFTDTLFVSEYFELARFGQVVLTVDERPSSSRTPTPRVLPTTARSSMILPPVESSSTTTTTTRTTLPMAGRRAVLLPKAG